MKRLTVLLLLVCLCSCSSRSYTSSLSCGEITDRVGVEVLGEGIYAEFDKDDVDRNFGHSELYDSQSIIYSASSDDVGEIGVFHAKDESAADGLLEAANEYLYALRLDKEEFLKNYIPGELKKLNGAQARRFGNYVVYAVLEPEATRSLFSFLDELLQK